ncbi:hypothetical protein ACLS0R_05610 [Comamonas jiangduensis]|uniref:hypothetical protein n=1 Tax=Comamonas jiangduensis TaxID=1194168 RepID=UPI003BF893E3
MLRPACSGGALALLHRVFYAALLWASGMLAVGLSVTSNIHLRFAMLCQRRGTGFADCAWVVGD